MPRNQDWLNLTVLRYESRPARGAGGAQMLLYNDLAHLRGVRGVTWE